MRGGKNPYNAATDSAFAEKKITLFFFSRVHCLIFGKWQDILRLQNKSAVYFPSYIECYRIIKQGRENEHESFGSKY